MLISRFSEAGTSTHYRRCDVEKSGGSCNTIARAPNKHDLPAGWIRTVYGIVNPTVNDVCPSCGEKAFGLAKLDEKG